MFIAPRRQRRAERLQRASPSMKRIAGEVAAFFGAVSSFKSGPRISVSESVHPSCSQLFGLQQSPLVAIEAEPPDPLKIDDDRPWFEMTSLPKLNHRAFAAVDHSQQIPHAILDASGRTELSRRSRAIHPVLRACHRIAPDNA